MPCPAGAAAKDRCRSACARPAALFKAPPSSRVPLASSSPAVPPPRSDAFSLAVDASSSPSGRLARPCEELGAGRRNVPRGRRLPRAEWHSLETRGSPSARRVSARLPGLGGGVWDVPALCAAVSPRRWARGQTPTPRYTRPSQHPQAAGTMSSPHGLRGRRGTQHPSRSPGAATRCASARACPSRSVHTALHARWPGSATAHPPSVLGSR